MNFENPFKKMKSILARWVKCPLTLDARILVTKVFAFSVLTHVLNCSYITMHQMEIVQKTLNDFVWHGKPRLSFSVMTAKYQQGGMQMLNVKNVYHVLKVKWMHRIAVDTRLIWSRFCWNEISSQIPYKLWKGMCMVRESSLSLLDPFYAVTICSFSMMNNLFFLKNRNKPGISDFPTNLWCHPKSPEIALTFASAEFCIVSDLPICEGKINVQHIIEHLGKNWANVFMTCYHLQSMFLKYFGELALGSFILHDDMLLQCKGLLLANNSLMLSLTNWEKALQYMPHSKGECEIIFGHMLRDCKYSKFHEINFKLLSRILLTLKILSKIKNKPSLANCSLCLNIATLGHILLHCDHTNRVRGKIVDNNMDILGKWTLSDWIFGQNKKSYNCVVWVFNFAIYKFHLRCYEGFKDDLTLLVQNEFYKYQ